MLDAKLLVPEIPKSGVDGVTFNRVIKRWVLYPKIEGRRKYVGAFSKLESAIKFMKEFQA